MWNRLASVQLDAALNVYAGDIGSDELTYAGTLNVGTWHWDVLYKELESPWGVRLAAVRLSKIEQLDVEEVAYEDDYAQWKGAPRENMTMVTGVGVDSGQILMQIGSDANDYEFLLDQTDAHVSQDAMSVRTCTGLGDGYYPVYLTRDAKGNIVDVRIIYLPEGPRPLVADEFVSLLAGALDTSEVEVGIKYEVHDYESFVDGDASNVEAHTYQTVTSLVYASDAAEDACELEWDRQESADKVRVLASRLGDLGQVGRVQKAGAAWEKDAVGWIVSHRVTPMITWVKLPADRDE